MYSFSSVGISVYYGRDRIPGVGVASSVAACLGAGRPVVVPGYCNFFDLSGREVIRYDNLDELELRLREALEGAESVKESLAAAREYAARNWPPGQNSTRRSSSG